MASRISRSLTDHPVCAAALGIGPLVAASHTLLSSILMGLTFTVVLLFSVASLSIVRNLVPHRSRLVFILLLTSTWVTIVDLLLQSFMFGLRMQADFYIPLLAMNSLVLLVMEKEALTTPVNRMAINGLAFAAVPVAVCLVNGLLREWLVHGRLLTDMSNLTERLPLPATSLPLFDTAAGAFIITGCLLALFNGVAARSRPVHPDRIGVEQQPF